MQKSFLAFNLSILLTLGLYTGVISQSAEAKAIGAWLFDEGEGNEAKDSSGNGVDGVLVGDPQWVDGKIGSALEVEPNKYVDFPPPLSEKMMVKRDLTCMAWLFPTQWDSGWNGCFSMQAGSTGGEIYGIYFNQGGGDIIFWTRIAGSAEGVSIGPGSVKLNEWVHAAVTYDGSKLILYRDGEKAGETAVSGDLDNADGKGRFVINGNYNSLDGGLSEWCFAIIDEVLVFDEVLTQAQIKAYMERGFKGVAPVDPAGKLAGAWAEIKASQ